jgi:hypothetical protein
MDVPRAAIGFAETETPVRLLKLEMKVYVERRVSAEFV